MSAMALLGHPLSSKLRYRRPSTTKMAALQETQRTRLPYDLKNGQTRFFHELSSGLGMEVICQKGDKSEKNTPLVFVHGSFHAAWCWAEYWMPFFSEKSFDCYAVSLLGQGESDAPKDDVPGTLQTHTSDLADFVRRNLKSPPVLIGHSFGGIIVQSYISDAITGGKYSLPISGAVLLCSMPPSGNGGIVLRYLLRKPVAAIKVTLSLAAKAFGSSLSLCKETFFSPTMNDSEVRRYQNLLKQSSRLPLCDLRKLNASLPLPPVPPGSINVLVLGAGSDFIVDKEGLNETAMFYGVEPVCLEGVAHDMMIDSSWEKGAEAILSWLRNLNDMSE